MTQRTANGHVSCHLPVTRRPGNGTSSYQFSAKSFVECRFTMVWTRGYHQSQENPTAGSSVPDRRNREISWHVIQQPSQITSTTYALYIILGLILVIFLLFATIMLNEGAVDSIFDYDTALSLVYFSAPVLRKIAPPSDSSVPTSTAHMNTF